MVFSAAPRFWGADNLGVGFHKLALELAQRCVSFLLDDGRVRNWLSRSLCHSRRNSWDDRRNALMMPAGGANIEVGGIVQVALRARQAVARDFSGGLFGGAGPGGLRSARVFFVRQSSMDCSAGGTGGLSSSRVRRHKSPRRACAEAPAGF